MIRAGRTLRPPPRRTPFLHARPIQESSAKGLLVFCLLLAISGDEVGNLVSFGPDEVKGRDLLTFIRERFGDSGFSDSVGIAESKLLEAGIPGVKYLDGMSRAAGAGTRNYVVFDDQLPTILERNGEPINPLGAQPIARGQRGAIGLLSDRPTLEEYQRSQRPSKKIKPNSKAKALRDEIREKRELRQKRFSWRWRQKQPEPKSYLKQRLFYKKMGKAKNALAVDLAEWVETAGGPWNKKFAGEVLDAGNRNYGIKEAVNRANLEAVPRLLKKEGWKLRHSSGGRGGRKSSRYLVSPNSDFEVRLSDHYLPDRPDRTFSSQSWDEELVLFGNERPEDIAEAIKLHAWANENNAEDDAGVADILEDIQDWNPRFDPQQRRQRLAIDKEMEQLQKRLDLDLYYPSLSGD